MVQWTTLNKVGLPLSIAAVLLFAAYALVIAHRRRQDAKHKSDDTEFFLTARKSIPTVLIAWSFFSSAVGSWVVFSLPQYVADPIYGAGYIGLICYAVAVGIPIIGVAFVGQHIRDRFPRILSWGDYAYTRYGRATQLYMTLIVLFNMSINLTAEFTAVGSLFEGILGLSPLIPIVLIGVVTTVYTAIGGLYVSIATDKYQGIFIMSLLCVTFIYIAAEFRLPSPRPPLPPTLDANYTGWASFATMFISLTAATFFSDAVWQRVWASADKRALRVGASMGAVLAIVVAFLFGFGGFLAGWAGYLTEDNNSNLAFFHLLTKGGANTDVWVIILVVLMAVTLNQSAVDSFQNAITDSVVSLAISCGFPKFPLWGARVTVVLLNIPLMIVGTQGYNIVQLYLITNMVTSTAVLPMLLGLSRRLEGYIQGHSCLFGCLFSLASVAVFGTLKTGSFTEGVRTYFYLVYDWPPFVIALVASVVGVALASGTEFVIRKALGKPTWVVRQVRDDHETVLVQSEEAEKKSESSV
ncbi:hypothetical protein BC832DRAFT_550007 [Gaertneriomyces semiglobifer]|nr:hypothetical protein BC832DRAFT_550007 [Gaertneriomyces semiglobifer]